MTKSNIKSNFLSGFVAITGPPNVGKSTLLNKVLGKKVAIVSHRPQTTRNRILGIYHGKGFQIAFLDTPGIHRTRSPLHKTMVSSARESYSEVDILMLVIDMHKHDDPEVLELIANSKKTGKPIILVINKIDMALKENLLPIINSYEKKYSFESIIPVSAREGDGIERIIDELKKRLEPGPEFFPAEMFTDQSESFFISEIIREKIYYYTKKELPYSSAVTVEKTEEKIKKNLFSITAVIHVESESQKAIIIGKRGRMIKKIGQSSRVELEKVFGIRVFLELIARVEKNWTKDSKALRRLGY